MTDEKQTDTVLASFPRPDQAKQAMVALEREGIPTRDIRLVNDVKGAGPQQQMRADERKVGWLARRWLIGAAVGALIGVVIVVIGVIVADPDPLVAVTIGAVLGGAVAGAFVGGLVSTGASLPRNPAAWDTYLLAHDDEACVAVQARGRGDRVSEVLRRAGASSVERVGDQKGGS